MSTVTTQLAERAKRVFRDLGYTVSNEGTQLRAERKWRVVHVMPVEGASEIPTSDEFHCFVTWADEATEVRDRLARRDVDCEWAVMGITDDGDYEVYRAGEAATV